MTTTTPTLTQRLRQLGALTLGFFAIHAARYLWLHQPYEVLWCCTIANLLIGGALIAGAPRINAIGVCWLFYGNGLWIADLLVSRKLIPTSLLIHWGGLLCGLYGVRQMGWPRRTYGWAVLALMGLQGLSRLVTPPVKNINVIFGLPTGFEGMFPNYPVYYAMMLATALAVFFATERLCVSFLSTK